MCKDGGKSANALADAPQRAYLPIQKNRSRFAPAAARMKAAPTVLQEDVAEATSCTDYDFNISKIYVKIIN